MKKINTYEIQKFGLSFKDGEISYVDAPTPQKAIEFFTMMKMKNTGNKGNPKWIVEKVNIKQGVVYANHPISINFYDYVDAL